MLQNLLKTPAWDLVSTPKFVTVEVVQEDNIDGVYKLWPVEARANTKPPHLPHKFRNFANQLAPNSAIKHFQSAIVRLICLLSLTTFEACLSTKFVRLFQTLLVSTPTKS